MINNNFQTPYDVVKYMCGLLYFGEKVVLEPTPGNMNIVNHLQHINKTVYYPTGNFWEMEMPPCRIDAVVMNPPFTPMAEGYKFLYKCMEISDHIIALMPWLTIINGEKRTKGIMNFGLVSITHLPRNIFPGSRVQTCILDMQRGHNCSTLFKVYKR